MSNVAILQARMSSSRLPGKVMQEINGRPMISIQIERILKSNVDSLILATSQDPTDDELANHVGSLGVQVFRGSLTDVHSRFLNLIASTNHDYFIRLTGDCPLVMSDLIDEMLVEFDTNPCDYLSNTNPPTFPDGLDIEIVSIKAFREMSKLELSELEKEHVTLGLYSRPELFKIRNFRSLTDYSHYRWTVDYPEDFEFIRNLYDHFRENEINVGMTEIIDYLESGEIENNLRSNLYRNVALSNRGEGNLNEQV